MKSNPSSSGGTSSRRMLFPLDFSGISLTESMFRRQFEAAEQYFLSIPDDDILKGFRERAGLPSPGSALGGWYSVDMNLPAMFSRRPTTLCNTFGQWIGALARMFSVTRRAQTLRKLNHLIEQWSMTIDDSGYFFYGDNPAIKHYDYDKTLGGLMDAYHYARNETALRLAVRITDWAITNLERRRAPATPGCQSGGGWSGGSDADVEWYTLSENIYRLYLATGDCKYRDFAEVWHYDTYWDRLSAGDPSAMIGLHAYSHVNTLSSAAMAYEVTGEPRFLRALRQGYELLLRNQSYATGGYGPGERLVSDSVSLSYSLLLQHDTFETACGTWAAFKLVRYLQNFSGEALYGDWAERLLYNAISAALPMGKNGRTFYYSDYCLSGGTKRYFQDAHLPTGPLEDCTPWPCCSGTYPLAVTDIHDLIYWRSDDRVCVNLYVPSVANLSIGRAKVSLALSTDYPNGSRSDVQMSMSASENFALSFRIPSWAKGSSTVSVNGIDQEVDFRSGDWATIRREWSDGDSVSIDIPPQLRFEVIGTRDFAVAALMYGPLVLATADEGPLVGDIGAPDTWLRRTREDVPEFVSIGTNPTKTFRPFYSFQGGEVYYMYHLVDGKSVAKSLFRR